MLKNWCFWTVVLEKTLESPLDCKEIKSVNPKGNQSWIFVGRTDAQEETPILWPPDGKNWLIGKDPDAGKDWRWEEKGMTEDEMFGWHHRGREFEQAPGIGDGQGSLACWSQWGQKELDMIATELNWTECFKCIVTHFLHMLTLEAEGIDVSSIKFRHCKEKLLYKWILQVLIYIPRSYEFYYLD